METARRVPLAERRERCARTVAAAQADPEARRARIHQRRSLRSYTDTGGEWHLHCRNNPEVGAAIMAALAPFRESIFRHARSEARHEPPEAYAADALTEMARRSAGAEVECSEARGTAPEAGGTEAGGTEAGGTKAGGAKPGAPKPWPRRPVGTGGWRHEGRWHGRGHEGRWHGGRWHGGRCHGRRRGRGAVGVAADVGGTGPAGPAGRCPAEARRRAGPPKIIVRVDLEALLRGRATDGEVCEIAGFGPVAVSAVAT